MHRNLPHDKDFLRHFDPPLVEDQVAFLAHCYFDLQNFSVISSPCSISWMSQLFVSQRQQPFLKTFKLEFLCQHAHFDQVPFIDYLFTFVLRFFARYLGQMVSLDLQLCRVQTQLDQPFFRPQFFTFIVWMIFLPSVLSYLAFLN